MQHLTAHSKLMRTCHNADPYCSRGSAEKVSGSSSSALNMFKGASRSTSRECRLFSDRWRAKQTRAREHIVRSLSLQAARWSF